MILLTDFGREVKQAEPKIITFQVMNKEVKMKKGEKRTCKRICESDHCKNYRISKG